MTSFNSYDFPEMSYAMMDQLFPDHHADELDSYLSTCCVSASTYAPTEFTYPPTESTYPPTESTYAPTESTNVPTELTNVPTESTYAPTTYAPTESLHAPVVSESSTHAPVVSESSTHAPVVSPVVSTHVPVVRELQPVVSMQSMIEDPLMLLLHFQKVTSTTEGIGGVEGGDGGAAGRTATSRVNFERVAFLARKMVKELNKADDTTSVAQFCNVLSHTMSSGVTPNVTSLMHQLEQEQLMLKLQNQHLRLQLQELEREEIRRAATPKRKQTDSDADGATALKIVASTETSATKEGVKKQRTLGFSTVQGEVYERLRGTKERKVDLIVRACLFKFGDTFVTKKQIEQVALDVGYFSGNTKELRQVVLTRSKAGRELNTKSYIKPWGHFFPYWEELASESGEMLLRLSPEFFKSTN